MRLKRRVNYQAQLVTAGFQPSTVIQESSSKPPGLIGAWYVFCSKISQTSPKSLQSQLFLGVYVVIHFFWPLNKWAQFFPAPQPGEGFEGRCVCVKVRGLYLGGFGMGGGIFTLKPSVAMEMRSPLCDQCGVPPQHMSMEGVLQDTLPCINTFPLPKQKWL